MRTTLLSIITTALLLMSGKTFMGQPGLPPGDYRRTCQYMRIGGDRLYATCQKARGGWRNTSIRYGNCAGPIINDDGNLRCGPVGYRNPGPPPGAYVGPPNGPYGGWRGGVPPGDYARTCQAIRMNGDRLDATCQNRNGGWHNTSLNNAATCRGGIVNDNGNLKCRRW